jgi:hypothetical protein
MIDESGAVGRMRFGKGNRSTGRIPASAPLCPIQTPHDLGSNPGRRGGKLPTNRLSYGVATQDLSFLFVVYFTMQSVSVLYIVGWGDHLRIGKVFEGSGRGLFVVLSRYLAGGTAETQEEA